MQVTLISRTIKNIYLSPPFKMITKVKRSPLFYVGDKYRLMAQLLDLFPKEINNFYEPFIAGGLYF